MKDNKKSLEPIDFVFGVACILVILVPISYWFNFRTNSIASDVSSWGAFGDFIGGIVNPILGFFSFMALLITLDLQRKQLNKTEEQLGLNRQELKLTREELQKAADAQVDSAKVMSEQLKTQALQQFENLFFALINQLQNRIEHLEEREIIQHLHSQIYLKQLGNNAYKSLIESIYCIIHNILENYDEDSSNDKLNNLKFQNKYMKILKSLITVEVMHFLIRDASDIVNTQEYETKKGIINKFGMLSKISFDVDNYRMKFWLMRSAYSLFDSDAFVKNSEYLNLKDSKINSFFYSRYPLSFEEALHRFFKSDLKNKNVIDEDNFGIEADDGTVIKFTKINEEIKINYINCELENFDFDNSKLSLIFNSLEHKAVRYTFEIHFDIREERLAVENIFRIPFFKKGGFN